MWKSLSYTLFHFSPTDLHHFRRKTLMTFVYHYSWIPLFTTISMIITFLYSILMILIQICITVIEARQLAGLNMDPVVCVQVCLDIHNLYHLYFNLSDDVMMMTRYLNHLFWMMISILLRKLFMIMIIIVDTGNL